MNASVTNMEPALLHGGNLVAARQLFPDAPEPFIDLSTGVNPHSYPVPPLSPDLFTRLPEPAALHRLSEIAAGAYGAPSRDCMVPAPGTQILLAPVAALVPPGRAAVLGPTYGEFARAAALAGHHVTEVEDIEQLRDADLAIMANPNNPDGGVAHHNIVVLRSFGKFFGLAGLRLGFALARPEIAARLAAALGPWAVSGPAVAIGEMALADYEWAGAMRKRLEGEARRLDAALSEAGIGGVGGTPLFRLVRTSAAESLFKHLGGAGILVRRFPEHAVWLRIGLPGSKVAWDRLRGAVWAFAS